MASDASRMPKVDMTKEFDNLSKTEQHFIKKLEQMNKERAKDLRVLRKRNLFTGLLFAGGVFGIYFYSMYAVRQEKFLEDFDTIPEKKQ